MQVMHLAKTLGTTAFVVGHVNKEGAIAGPKVLEHMVDCVLYFEGDRPMPASSSSVCMNFPPTCGSRFAIPSAISVDGVIG